MRGNKQPAILLAATAAQSSFRGLSRHRRTKLARAAHTNLLKADQWGRGDGTEPEIASALEHALKGIGAKWVAKA
jgi:hypothetical protein